MKKRKTSRVQVIDNGQLEPGFEFKIDGRKLPRVSSYTIESGWDKPQPLVTVTFYATVEAKFRDPALDQTKVTRNVIRKRRAKE